MPDEATLHEPVVLDIDACQPVEWNPNQEDLATFNELVRTIKEVGFTDPIQVVPLEDGDTYSIVAGEHRWKAAKLAGMTQVTAVVHPEWDDDKQRIENIRHNVMRGKFDPQKFTELWTELERKYGHEALLKATGMRHKEAQVERMIRQVRKDMPEEMRKEFDKRKDKIRNVEDIATVVQSLYARHGSTLKQGYMFFQFGGRTHLMVQMEKGTATRMRELLKEVGNADEIAQRVVNEIAAELQS